MAALSARLDAIFGEIIAIPDLAQRSMAGPDTMACIRYERRSDEVAPVPGQKRMGAHSDYTTFTILRADPVPGLEILTSGADPASAGNRSSPTRARCSSTSVTSSRSGPTMPGRQQSIACHCAVTAPTQRLRRSVAYFHYPDLDVSVEPLQAFRHAETRYSPVTVAEHLAARLIGPKQHEPSAGTSTVGDRQL